MSKFEQFALNKQIIKALDYAKFIEPTTIQNKIIYVKMIQHLVIVQSLLYITTYRYKYIYIVRNV